MQTKKIRVQLKGCTQMTLLINPFPANLYSAFPIGAPFSALSILTILLHKCHMKSFENINISMKVKLFC